jgi:thioesterase domain-containing protein
MARALVAAENAANSTTEPAFIVLQPQGSRPPICWLPGGSGLSALSVRSVSLLLGPDQPVYALETPVRREGPFDLRRRAAAYVAALRARLAPPYWLFGFSYGAWMALEMGRQMGATAVKQLVVFDAVVPRDFTPRERALKAAQHLRWHLQRARTEPLKELSRLANGLLRRTGLISAPASGDPTLPLGSVYDVVDSAVRAAIWDYAQEPQTPWPGRITLVFGERRNWPGMAGELDLRMGWRGIASGGLDVIRVPGDHLSMLEGVEADDLAAKLRALLETGAAG